MNKTFDKNLKNNNDPIAKILTREIIKDWVGGVFIRDNVCEDEGTFEEGIWDQEFYIPIITKSKKIKTESEMKNSDFWNKKNFSFPFKYETMNIPYRKIKNDADLFFVISTCGTLAWVVSGKKLINSEVIRKSTKYLVNESFFSIPITKGKFFEKRKGKWEKY